MNWQVQRTHLAVSLLLATAMLDPVGFALENFDAVGRWRDFDGGRPVDAAGGLPDGSQFTGVDGLEHGLLKHPDVFVGTLAERLLTFALGRGVEPYDAPAVRQIVRQAAADDYRFSSHHSWDRPKHSLHDASLAMIVTKKALPRRTFLRGIGVTFALPLLDAMVPALTAMAKTPASPQRLRRLGYVYMPMGCDITRWTPPGR